MSGGRRRSGPAPSSRVVQQRLPERPHPDPAKRGRNAEFFIFSRHFVGSDSTGYVDSELLAGEEPQLDLASAVAISGAAVSSSMGRISVGWLGPTLALLNLRLGFWLRNPKFVRAAAEQAENANTRAAAVDQSADASWEDILRLYLFAEAFGRLRSDSPRIYITDGGHIDNIGLYQLLKRQCKFIIVIDAEADPGMNFGAFADVQRFARIDEGVLISLEWWPVRAAALARSADRSKQVPRDSETHKRHFAVGRIIYEDGEEGILLYIKATVTGDEPDYVLDYERRYPNFPHEATSDQFFSEEQMEAYRALGFHATRRALDEGTDAAAPKQTAPAKAEPAKKGRCRRKNRGKARARAAGRQTVRRKPDRARQTGPQTEGRPRRPGRLDCREAPGGNAVASLLPVVLPGRMVPAPRQAREADEGSADSQSDFLYPHARQLTPAGPAAKSASVLARQGQGPCGGIGRRGRLKICCPHGRAGSIPARGTKHSST